MLGAALAMMSGAQTLDELAARAKSFEQAREHAKAVEVYTQILKLRPDLAAAYDRRGYERFKLGEIDGALADFDKAIALDPAEMPYHWQRGIALYYAGRYEDGVRQFDAHQKVNGNDVENAAWRYLCMARAGSVEKARTALIPIEGDPRVPMSQIHTLFAGKGSVEQVLAAVGAGNPAAAERNQRLFYADLYIGLYHEAAGRGSEAKKYITRAAGYQADHYMGDVARVHAARLRGKTK